MTSINSLRYRIYLQNLDKYFVSFSFWRNKIVIWNDEKNSIKYINDTYPNFFLMERIWYFCCLNCLTTWVKNSVFEGQHKQRIFYVKTSFVGCNSSKNLWMHVKNPRCNFSRHNLKNSNRILLVVWKFLVVIVDYNGPIILNNMITEN